MNIALVFPRLNSRSGDPPLGLGYLASNLTSSLGAFTTALFAVHVAGGIFAYSMDMRYPFSAARSVVEYDSKNRTPPEGA